MKQSEVFLQGEGDAWYERNKDKSRLPDPVLDAIAACELKPKNVIEYGCGTGWRLYEINRLYGSDIYGVDPSAKAIEKARTDEHYYCWDVGTLTTGKNTLLEKNQFDMVIFGFCLYLADREDLMMIAAHADHILKDRGNIVIHDFLDGPYKVPYKHKEGIWSYHMDHSSLWFGHPGYAGRMTRRINEEQVGGVVVLWKDFANAFPEMEII